MAINEQIIKNRKFRKCIDVANRIWLRISFWTAACDVEFEDGKTLEDKLGTINGITDSLETEDVKTALSANAGKILNDKIEDIKNTLLDIISKLGGLSFKVLTQAEYDALLIKAPKTLYFIYEYFPIIQKERSGEKTHCFHTIVWFHLHLLNYEYGF